MASVHAVRPVNAVPVYLRCFLCLINAGCRTLRFSGAPLALRMYLRRCGFLHSGYRIAQSRQGVRFVRLDWDDHALIQQHFDPEPKSDPQKTRLSLAQQPREQSFEQNSYLRIHLSKFDTHALTRHDVSDNRFRQNHSSGYFKYEGQLRAYSQGIGPAEEQTSHA